MQFKLIRWLCKLRIYTKINNNLFPINRFDHVLWFILGNSR
jgi:hypothetical protein